MDIQTLQISDPLWLQTLSHLQHDVFHLPEYLSLEAWRLDCVPEAFLVTDRDKQFFIPYLLRSCAPLFDSTIAPSSLQDAISPYGYPGILTSAAAAQDPNFLRLALDQLLSHFRSKHVCSAFLRLHPIFNQDLIDVYPPDLCHVTGETVWIDLTQPEAEIWRQTRSDHRKDINRHKRSGSVAKMVAVEEYLPEFIQIYYETMDRAGAVQQYYFSYDFFDRLLELKPYLHLCIVEIEGQITSACLLFECCGIVQSFLGGTKNKFVELAPEKLLFDYIRFWAKERGNQVYHMGGGVGSEKDGVYYFKAGFSKLRQKFLTLRLIVDNQQYLQLVELQAHALKSHPETLIKTGFFPAYRCSKNFVQDFEEKSLIQSNDPQLQSV